MCVYQVVPSVWVGEWPGRCFAPTGVLNICLSCKSLVFNCRARQVSQKPKTWSETWSSSLESQRASMGRDMHETESVPSEVVQQEQAAYECYSELQSLSFSGNLVSRAHSKVERKDASSRTTPERADPQYCNGFDETGYSSLMRRARPPNLDLSSFEVRALSPVRRV